MKIRVDPEHLQRRQWKGDRVNRREVSDAVACVDFGLSLQVTRDQQYPRRPKSACCLQARIGKIGT